MTPSQNWASFLSAAMMRLLRCSSVCRAENGDQRDQVLANRLSPSALVVSPCACPGSGTPGRDEPRVWVWVEVDNSGSGKTRVFV